MENCKQSIENGITSCLLHLILGTRTTHSTHYLHQKVDWPLNKSKWNGILENAQQLYYASENVLHTSKYSLRKMTRLIDLARISKFDANALPRLFKMKWEARVRVCVCVGYVFYVCFRGLCENWIRALGYRIHNTVEKYKHTLSVHRMCSRSGVFPS